MTAPAFIVEWAHCSPPAAALVDLYDDGPAEPGDETRPRDGYGWLYWHDDKQRWGSFPRKAAAVSIAVRILIDGISWYSVSNNDNFGAKHRGDGGPAVVSLPGFGEIPGAQWWVDNVRVDTELACRQRAAEWEEAAEAYDHPQRESAPRGRRLLA